MIRKLERERRKKFDKFILVRKEEEEVNKSIIPSHEPSSNPTLQHTLNIKFPNSSIENVISFY
jgi:hypothetical protein